MLIAEKIAQTPDTSISEEDTLIEIVEQSSISDKLGIIGSGLCLVHCLVLPFLLPFFTTTTSTSFEHGPESWFHGVIFPALLLFAISAFSRGYKIHGSKKTLVLGISGIAIIALGLLEEYLPTINFASPEIITSTGSVLLVVAHIFNITKIRALKPHIHSSSCGCRSKSSDSTKVVQLRKSNG